MTLTLKRISPVVPALAFALCAFSLSVGDVKAQPAENATMNPANKAPRAKKAMIGRKILKGIEEKTGKTLSPEVREQMVEVAKTRAAAVKAADDKMIADLAKLSGLTVEEIAAIVKPAKKEGKGGKKAVAPAAG